VPPPTTGGALVKEVAVAQLATALSVEKELPSSGIAEEVRLAVKDAQPISSFASLAVQDPAAFQPPIPQDPKPGQTSSPTKTVTFEPTTEFALGKEFLGGASSSTRAGKPYPSFISTYSYFPYPFFLKVLVSFPLLFPLGQTSSQSTLEASPSLELEASEGVYCHPHSSPLLVHIFPFSLSILLFFSWRSPRHLSPFSDFAKVSLPFFQCALCSFTESFKRSKGWEEELPVMVKVATQAQKEIIPQGIGNGSLAFSFLSVFISSYPLSFLIVCFRKY